MKLLRYLLPAALALCGLTTSTASAYCHGSQETFHNDNLQRDFLAVQNYINSKRSIPLQEKVCNLSISGDVRAVWANINESINTGTVTAGTTPGSGGVLVAGTDGHHSLRSGYVKDDDAFINGSDLPVLGAANGTPYSQNAFSTDFNLYIDYTCERAWAVAWLEFDNIAGVEQSNIPCMNGQGFQQLPVGVNPDPEGPRGSGCCDDLCLRKAYLGYNVWADGCNRFDIEIGRRPLYTVFDSVIQFQNRFDGVLLRYAQSFDCVGDFYVNLGGFVIDERVNQFGYVVETGLLNIMDWGFDLKYSFIDWAKRGTNRCQERNPFGWNYRISQVTAAYRFCPELFSISQPVRLYGAALWNHAGHSLNFANASYGKKNFAWYAGATIGQICCEGDWAFDFNYQYVEAHAIPDSDISGISNGNTLQNTWTQNLFAGGAVNAANIATARGRGNYKGWRFEAMYALTDNLLIDASYEFSRATNSRIGGKHNFEQFQLETIYAF